MTTLSATLSRNSYNVTVPTGIWLGNQLVSASDNATFPVLDPATELELTQVADAGSVEWNRALELADAAWGAWAEVLTRRRSEILSAIFAGISDRAQEFATVMSFEMGKPIAESLGEVAYGAEYFRWFAEEAVRPGGRISPAPALATC